MADKHVKRYLASLVIREMQMESAAGCHVTSTRTAIALYDCIFSYLTLQCRNYLANLYYMLM